MIYSFELVYLCLFIIAYANIVYQATVRYKENQQAPKWARPAIDGEFVLDSARFAFIFSLIFVIFITIKNFIYG